MKPDRLLGAALVVASMVIFIGCASAGATPATSRPSPTGTAPARSTAPARPTAPVDASTPGAGAPGFESERYGYRLVPPSGWTVMETPGRGGLHPGEPGVDTFKDDLGHILSVVGEPAEQLGGWTCAIALHLEGEHKLPVETSEDVVVGGEPARLLQYHLLIKPYVIHYLTVELVHEGRGLTLSLESTTVRDDEDRRILDALLASVDLVAHP